MKKTNDIDSTAVLLHGLGGSRLDMWPISCHLKKAGYSTKNWGYSSIFQSIQSHAHRLGRLFEKLESDSSVGQFHIVAHSMGSIVTRTLLANSHWSKLKRIVMLSPPNKGSHVARKLAPFAGSIVPNLKRLSDDPESYVNSLPDLKRYAGIDVGIVEATKDRVVSADCVQLNGQKDFVRVVGHHGLLPWYPQVSRLVKNFLSAGRFQLNTKNE